MTPLASAAGTECHLHVARCVTGWRNIPICCAYRVVATQVTCFRRVSAGARQEKSRRKAAFSFSLACSRSQICRMPADRRSGSEQTFASSDSGSLTNFRTPTVGLCRHSDRVARDILSLGRGFRTAAKAVSRIVVMTVKGGDLVLITSLRQSKVLWVRGVAANARRLCLVI